MLRLLIVAVPLVVAWAAAFDEQEANAIQFEVQSPFQYPQPSQDKHFSCPNTASCPYLSTTVGGTGLYRNPDGKSTIEPCAIFRGAECTCVEIVTRAQGTAASTDSNDCGPCVSMPWPPPQPAAAAVHVPSPPSSRSASDIAELTSAINPDLVTLTGTSMNVTSERRGEAQVDPAAEIAKPSMAATAPLPGILAMLGLLCAALYGAVQGFSALGVSAVASIPGPPPPEGQRAVGAASASCRPSARCGSAGRFGAAPRLAGVLFIVLMVGFASAQTPPSPTPSPPSPPSRPPVQPPRPALPGWGLEAQNVNGRRPRRYPTLTDYALDLQPGGHPTAFAPPNCSAPGRVGCVAMPRPTRAKPAPGARAALLPPACSLSSETGCLRLPKPMARTGSEPLGSTQAVLQFLERILPNSSLCMSIAAADVDGDGDLDVLLGNYGSPSRVLLNAGDGTFPTSIVLPGGSADTLSIAAADVDGDGDLDVLLGNSGSDSRVLLNAGDGTFSTSIELPGGSADTQSIAAADVDGDGDLDVLLGNCLGLGQLLGNYYSPSRVMLNSGNGTFPTSTDLPGESACTQSIVAVDVDGDGDLDVLLGNDRSPSQVLLNGGDGTFPTSITLPGNENAETRSIAAADVDGDGDLDVLLGN
eukprot:jgi/Chrpa1/20392/Chrysochromulina_OHIO_Genome00025999-RA